MSSNLDNNPQLGQKAFVSMKIGMIDASGTYKSKNYWFQADCAII
jgi:hypothetical protein